MWVQSAAFLCIFQRIRLNTIPVPNVDIKAAQTPKITRLSLSLGWHGVASNTLGCVRLYRTPG